jgi:hypothetical protein
MSINDINVVHFSQYSKPRIRENRKIFNNTINADNVISN